MMGKNQELLRKLPKIDEMLQDEHLIFFTEIMPRQVVVETLREVIDMVRREIIDGRREEIPAVEELAGLVKQRVFEEQGKSLAPCHQRHRRCPAHQSRESQSIPESLRERIGGGRLLLKPGIRYKERQQRFAP